MNGIDLTLLSLSTLLFFYLVYAMIKPERF